MFDDTLEDCIQEVQDAEYIQNRYTNQDEEIAVEDQLPLISTIRGRADLRYNRRVVQAAN